MKFNVVYTNIISTSIFTQIQTQSLIYKFIIFDSPNFQRELNFNAYLDKKICQ